MSGTGRLVALNVGRARPATPACDRVTGIDKNPVSGRLRIADPGAKGSGGSGVAGDSVCDLRHHGGHDQAVYAYAREDLDEWEELLGRRLAGGSFGENLTTSGIDLTSSLVGQRWRVGEECVLQVTAPRIPCRTFAGWLDERGWVRRFTDHAKPGAYLRVVSAGEVGAGDEISLLERPSHDVTVGLCFAALTTSPELLEALLDAGELLPDELRRAAARRGRAAARSPRGRAAPPRAG